MGEYTLFTIHEKVRSQTENIIPKWGKKREREKALGSEPNVLSIESDIDTEINLDNARRSSLSWNPIFLLVQFSDSDIEISLESTKKEDDAESNLPYPSVTSSLDFSFPKVLKSPCDFPFSIPAS